MPARTCTDTSVSTVSAAPLSAAVTVTVLAPPPSSTLSGESLTMIPVDASSSSVTVTATSRAVRPGAPDTGWLTVAVSSSESASARAVTVTVRSSLQFCAVNRRLVGVTVTSVSPVACGRTVTVPDGAESSTTV